jgi:hypothetical protein
MSVNLLFFVCLAIFFVGLLGAVANFAFLAKKFDRIDDFGTSFGKPFIFHALFGLLYITGGVGMVITGIIWIVQTLKG